MTKPNMHAEPEHVRRKLAEAYRREAAKTGQRKADRTAFQLMAEAWERTLPEHSKK
jgi:hypothetical protein